MAEQIRARRGTAAQWTAENPVLALGEVGVETDTMRIKVGDGSTAWNSLDAYTKGPMESGKYTPTVSNLNNVVASPTSHPHNYVRVGNVVMVFGSVALSTTIAGNDSSFEITLPIAPTANFTNAYDLMGSVGGVGDGSGYMGSGIVGAVASTKRAVVAFNTDFNTGQPIRYSFSYVID